MRIYSTPPPPCKRARRNPRNICPDRRVFHSLAANEQPQPIAQGAPMLNFRKKAQMPDPATILPGRATPLQVPERHFVNGNRITPPFPEGTRLATFGLGC